MKKAERQKIEITRTKNEEQGAQKITKERIREYMYEGRSGILKIK